MGGRPRLRLFLAAWIVYSAYFATNVVREHYPAFSLVERGDFVLDDYAGFHSDIFQHADGHYYIVNQVTTSILAAIPLFAFEPLLDALQRRRLEELAAAGPEAGPEADIGPEYRSPYPLRQEFYRKVRERGLDLRFGAATAITTAFLMAPLSALLAVLFLGLLERRGVPPRRAFWLAVLLAFGTPLFYRTETLSNNTVLMHCVFLSFLALWPADGALPAPRRRLAAGLLAGLGVAVDYAGVVAVPFLLGYLVGRLRGRGTWPAALRGALGFVAGLLPGLGLLLFTQWAMFGNPFLPAQAHMPEVNYTDRGWHGFGWPAPDLFWQNLASPNFGLVPYGPLLLLALVPLALARRLRGGPTGALAGEAAVLPPPERTFAALFALAFLLFCAANQYARMQWNTGFRYLVVLVPFLYLAACDVLARLRGRTLAVVGGAAVLHTWVLCMTRYTVPSTGGTAGGNAVAESWRLVLEHGPTLPWLDVLRRTRAPEAWIQAAWVPPAATLLVLACVLPLLRAGGARGGGDTAGAA